MPDSQRSEISHQRKEEEELIVIDRGSEIDINIGLKPRSWGASTPMKMCIQAVLDSTRALRHMDKNNSERPVCTTHPLASISTSFLFIFDTEWVMSTCEHQGRDIVL